MQCSRSCSRPQNLRRPKFSRISAEAIDSALNLIRSVAIIVNPTETLAVSTDETDNRFLECAEAANTDYLVRQQTPFPASVEKNGSS
jgi:predicted nucleic acid-binding protein